MYYALLIFSSNKLAFVDCHEGPIKKKKMIIKTNCRRDQSPPKTVLTHSVEPKESYNESNKQHYASRDQNQQCPNYQWQQYYPPPSRPPEQRRNPSPFCRNCQEPHLSGQHTQPQGFNQNQANRSYQSRNQTPSQSYGYNSYNNRPQGYYQQNQGRNYSPGYTQQRQSGNSRNQAPWRPDDGRMNNQNNKPLKLKQEKQ